jgi:hypothetical protein
MKQYCQANLIDLKSLLEKLNQNQYTTSLNTLSGASIGQHYRHILELYQCLLQGLKRDEINYDARHRNQNMEVDIEFATSTIDKIIEDINSIASNKIVTLKGNFACEKEGEINIITSIYRELAYNIEHSIHHQALIRIGLMELECDHYIDTNFGVAPSTVRFRQKSIPTS